MAAVATLFPSCWQGPTSATPASTRHERTPTSPTSHYPGAPYHKHQGGEGANQDTVSFYVKQMDNIIYKLSRISFKKNMQGIFTLSLTNVIFFRFKAYLMCDFK